MLVSVMQSLKSPDAPVFECTKTADGSGFKATVKIDVSTTRASSDQGVEVKELEGAVCNSPELAITSAVNEALVYLASKRFVRIKDHSTKVTDDFPNHQNWLSVNSVSDELLNAFQGYHAALKRFDKVRLDFDVNEKAETQNGIATPVAVMYGEMVKDLVSDIETQGAVYRKLKREFDEEMEFREKYHEETNNRSRQWRLKCCYQEAKVSEKCILGYLTSYFGMPAPLYGTHYTVHDGYKGSVVVDFPDIDYADAGGSITFTGTTSYDARDAEDEAAYNALKFFEDTLKVVPIDLNYSARVDAKKSYAALVNLLECFHLTVDKVRKGWKHLINCMDVTCKYYSTDYKYQLRTDGNMPEHESRKLEACIKSLQEVYTESLKEYEVGAAKLKELEQYYPRRIYDGN